MIIYEFLIRHESSVTRREWSIRSVRSFKIILNSSCYQRLIRNLLYTVVMILLSLLLLNSLKWIVVITSEWYSRLVAHDTEYSFQLRFNFQNTYQQSSTSDRPIRAKSIDLRKWIYMTNCPVLRFSDHWSMMLSMITWSRRWSLPTSGKMTDVMQKFLSMDLIFVYIRQRISFSGSKYVRDRIYHSIVHNIQDTCPDYFLLLGSYSPAQRSEYDRETVLFCRETEFRVVDRSLEIEFGSVSDY